MCVFSMRMCLRTTWCGVFFLSFRWSVFLLYKMNIIQNKPSFIFSSPLSLLSLCSLRLLFSTMSMIKTRTATTRTEVMVTTIFSPPLPDMLSEMGSPVLSKGGIVPKEKKHLWAIRHLEPHLNIHLECCNLNLFTRRGMTSSFLSNV